jgi:hypothetical protein
MGTVIKFNMENAFNRVNHCFLLNVLGKFDFSEGWIDWVRAHISVSWIAPLVIGISTVFCGH